MKKSPFLLIIIVLIIILCQSPFISLFTNNQNVISFFSFFVFFLIAYPIYLIYKIFKTKVEDDEEILLQQNSILQDELNKIQLSTKYNCIFYQHNIDEPFAWVSDSVSNILGVSVEKFKLEYKLNNSKELYEGAINRVKKADQNGIRVPLYEIEIESGNKVKFEVREMPLYNFKQEIIGVWGTLLKIKEDKLPYQDDNKNYDYKYNLLIENITEAVLIIKGDRFVDCNTNALDLFESTKEQLLMYSPFLRKFSPQIQPSGKGSKEEALKYIHLAYEGYPQKFIWQHLKNYGNPFMVEVNLSRFEWDNEYYLMAISRDLTFRNECNIEIEEKNKLLKIMTENISKGITVIVNDRIEMTNSKLESITSYSENELNSLESLFIFAAELEKIRLHHLYTEIISGLSETNLLSYWFKKKDGKYIYIKNEYFIDKENTKNRYILTSDITKEIVDDFKQNPTEENKKQLEIYQQDL